MGVGGAGQVEPEVGAQPEPPPPPPPPPPVPGRGQRSARRSRRRTVLRWTGVGLVVAALAVEVVLGHHQLAHAARAISDPRWSWLSVAVVADVASMIAFASHQLRLVRGAGGRVRRTTMTSLAFAAHSLSITLPGGPVFSTAYNYRRLASQGVSRTVASWVIGVSAGLSAVSLAALGAASGVAAGTGGDLWHLLGAVVLIAALVLLVRLLGARPRWLQVLVGSVRAWLAPLLRREAAAALERTTATVQQLLSVRISAGAWIASSAGAVVNWLLDAVCLALCLRAVGAGHVGAVQLLLVYCAGMAAASFPIVPAGLGVVDTALTVGLVAAGVRTGDALAGVVLFRVVSLGLIGGAGWVLWLLDRDWHRAARQ